MNDDLKTESGETPWWMFVVWSFNPKRYREIVEAAIWPALAAVFVIGVIQAGIASGRVATRWPQEVENFKRQWEASFPKVKISNGIATSDQTSLATGEITLWDQTMPVAIDTTGKTREIDSTWTEGFLLTTAEYVIRTKYPGAGSKLADKRLPLKNITDTYGEITMDSDGINKLAEKLKPQWVGSIFLQGIVRYAISKAMHVFMGSLITLLITGLTRRRTRLGKLIKLGFYALIPTVAIEIIIILILPLFSESVYQGFFILYAAIYVTYLALAALNIEQDVKVEEES